MFGNPADFPFTDNQGVFKAGFDFTDASLNYLNGWPQATGMQGRYDVEGTSIHITANDGLLDGMRFSSVDARINNFFNPVLELSSTSAGSFAELIEFGNTGPLKKVLSPALIDVSTTGQVQMDLNLSVPLRRKVIPAANASSTVTVKKPAVIPGLKVNGSIFLNNNSVSLARAKLDLDKVTGAVGFTNNRIRANNLQALMNGRPVRIDAKTEGQGQARIAELRMEGPMRASSIMDNYDIPLTRFVEGESQWNVSVRIPMSAAQTAEQGISVAAVSDLVGTQLRLPAPLSKSSGSPGRLALSSTLIPNSTQRQWLIDYKDMMRSIVRVDNAGLESFSARFGGDKRYSSGWQCWPAGFGWLG